MDLAGSVEHHGEAHALANLHAHARLVRRQQPLHRGQQRAPLEVYDSRMSDPGQETVSWIVDLEDFGRAKSHPRLAEDRQDSAVRALASPQIERLVDAQVTHVDVDRTF